MRQRRITYNEKRTTSVLGGVRRRIASVSVHTQYIPEEHLAADAVLFYFSIVAFLLFSIVIPASIIIGNIMANVNPIFN